MRGHLLDHLEKLALGAAWQAGDALVGDEQQERTDVVEALPVPHRSSEIQSLHGLAEPIKSGNLSCTPNGDVVMWRHPRRLVLRRTVAARILVAATASLRVVAGMEKEIYNLR